jgi:DNA relaxase NicK
MPDSDEVVDCGVDWLTVTANTKSSIIRLLDYSHNAMRDEREAGNEKRGFSFKGYEGFKCGGISYGARSDSALLRVSGGLARQHFTSAYHVATNCSRIDLQTTVRTKQSPNARIASAFKRALRHSRKLKRGPAVNLWRSSNGTATLYLGQRVSERFGRVYNKGAESLLPVLEDCVRYEVEYKGDMAMHQFKQLANTRSPALFINSEVHRFFRARACPPEFKPENTQTNVLHRMATDQRQQLEWIAKCVRPTVQRLCASGLAQEVYDCLQLGEVMLALEQKNKFADTVRRLQEVA